MMHSCRSGKLLRCGGHGLIQGGQDCAAAVPADLSGSSHVFVGPMARDNSTAPLAPARLNLMEPEYSMPTFDYVTEAIASALNVYYTPLLVLLGCIGNMISIYVFYTSKLRMQSTSLYLSALAISDTAFLLQLVPPWLNAMLFTSLFHRPGFCQIFVYTSYVSCCLSAWLVVAFTVERFVAVLYPLQRNSMCTVTRAKSIIFMLVSSALILNIPVLKFASPSTNDCNIDFDYMEHAARFNYVDTAMSFTLPLAIIVILNAWIIVGVYRLEHARRLLIKAGQAACPRAPRRSPPAGRAPITPAGRTRIPLAGRTRIPLAGRVRSPPAGRARSPPRTRPLPPACVRSPPPPPRSQHRITRMLLVVSSVFVIFNVPAYTMRILAYAYNMSTGEYSGRWAALQQLALMFFNTNFGINFILYCLSGQNFRRALCQSMPCLRSLARRTDAMRLTSRNVVRASSVTTSCASATEATTAGVGAALAGRDVGRVRRHRSEPVIERWTFDNSRSQRALDQRALEPPIEMQDLSRAAPASDASI